jgi:hypothetical protein
MSHNSNQLHGHGKVRNEGRERKLDDASIDRIGLLADSVPAMGSAIVSEFALKGGTPTIPTTREEQLALIAVIREVEATNQALAERQPGYADVAPAMDIQTHRLGGQALRAETELITEAEEEPLENNGVNPAYLSTGQELENA